MYTDSSWKSAADTSLQRVLEKQLLKHGYDVHTADNGAKALDFLKSTKHWAKRPSQTEMEYLTNANTVVDVILMDIEMPVMNGLKCTEVIRDLQQSKTILGHIPIIAVSANARTEQTTQAIAAGMDDAISKPFRIPDLIPKLEKLMHCQG